MRRGASRAVAGDEFAGAARALDEYAAGLRLSGFAGSPAFSRGSRDAQFVFVNGRFVRDKLLAHALRQAYQDMLHGDRHAGLCAVPGARSRWAWT